MCKLYVGALVSEHRTNQNSLKIQENQNEIHEPSFKYTYVCSIAVPLGDLRLGRSKSRGNMFALIQTGM